MKKNVNKIFVFGVVSVFLLMLVTTFVMAAPGDISYTLGGELAEFFRSGQSFINGFSDEAGMDWGSGAQATTTILFAILLTMIVYSVLDSVFFFKNFIPFVRVSIAIAISLLALIGLPPGYLNSISTSYGAMGASILVVIPFLIVLAFTIKVENLFIARLTWIAFAGYYLIIYIQRITLEALEGGIRSTANLPNFIGFIIGIIAFFMLPYIRRLMFRGELNADMEKALQDVKIRQYGRRVERAEARSRGIGSSIGRKEDYDDS